MPKWRKTLERMVADPKPVGYSYDEAAVVLRGLGFALAPHGGTSHRKWRYKRPDGLVVVVGLVEGSDPLKAYLIRTMVKQLCDAGLI